MRPILDSIDPNLPEEERKEKRYSQFVEKYNDLLILVKKNRPFYPQNIYTALVGIMKIADKEAFQYRISHPDRLDPEKHLEYWENAKKNSEIILSEMDTICEAIRSQINI